MRLDNKNLASLYIGDDFKVGERKKKGLSLRVHNGPFVDFDPKLDPLYLSGLSNNGYHVSLNNLAHTWDKDLASEVGKAIGSIERNNNIDLLLGPICNIKRNPLCGKPGSSFGEDPLLNGELCSYLVNGIQSQGVGVCLGEFNGLNQESYAYTADSIIDNRALNELYLKPFEIAVKGSKPVSIMVSPNKVNGTRVCSNKLLLRNTLKSKWGFKGVTISSFGAYDDPIHCHNDGLDITFPSPKRMYKKLSLAYRLRSVDHSELSDSKKRVYSLLEKLSSFQNNKGTISQKESETIFENASRDSIVLLKNDKNILPLTDLDSFCVIGELAHSLPNPGKKDTWPLPFIKAMSLRTGKPVPFSAGYSFDKPKPGLVEDALDLANRSKTVLLFLGFPYEDNLDKKTMLLTDDQLRLFDSLYAVNKNIVVCLLSSRPLELPFLEKAKAILLLGEPDKYGSYAAFDVISGKTSPSGKLTQSWPIRYSDCPSFGFYPGSPSLSIYRESIYVGYRYYSSLGKKIAFPFGHGLSYGKVSFDKITVPRKNAGKGDSIEVNLELHNQAEFPQKKVIQIYLSKEDGNAFRPKRVLVAFSKVELPPSKTIKTSIVVPYEAFSIFDIQSNRFVVEDGEYFLEVGDSVEDIIKKVPVHVDGVVLPSLKNEVPTYYQLTPYGFLENDADFESILKHRIPVYHNTRVPPFNLNSTLNDISETRIGKKILKKNKGFDLFMPIRHLAYYGYRIGKVHAIVDLANGHYLLSVIHSLFLK